MIEASYSLQSKNNSRFSIIETSSSLIFLVKSILPKSLGFKVESSSCTISFVSSCTISFVSSCTISFVSCTFSASTSLTSSSLISSTGLASSILSIAHSSSKYSALSVTSITFNFGISKFIVISEILS